MGNICPDWDTSGALKISTGKGVGGMWIDETMASLVKFSGIRKNKRRSPVL
jgi:hypothetical protein